MYKAQLNTLGEPYGFHWYGGRGRACFYADHSTTLYCVRVWLKPRLDRTEWKIANTRPRGPNRTFHRAWDSSNMLVDEGVVPGLALFDVATFVMQMANARAGL